ncbi:MAG: hypothetical protein QOD81_1603 [Solirubrobacteraceae bacterium]|nr:hypothetical protein [Solirubrobacteraceae bacterium]
MSRDPADASEPLGRLGELQAVVLDVGEEAIDCRVAVVLADQATIEPVSAADASYIPSLGRAATLVFDVRGAKVRVPGAVRRGPLEGQLRFKAGGGEALPRRRRAPRVGAEVAVEVTPLGDDGEPAAPSQRLQTSDVSLGGVGVRVGSWSAAIGAVVSLALELPGPPMTATARVMRLDDGIAGLELTKITPADRARLAAFLIAQRLGA